MKPVSYTPHTKIVRYAVSFISFPLRIAVGMNHFHWKLHANGSSHLPWNPTSKPTWMYYAPGAINPPGQSYRREVAYWPAASQAYRREIAYWPAALPTKHKSHQSSSIEERPPW